MMREAILNFAKQFVYEPRIENAGKLKAAKRFVVCGLGGSHLAAEVLQSLKPELPMIIHRDYGLPSLPESDWGETFVIASSYSGNTEEVIAAFGEAQERKLNLLAIAVGGKLLDLARASATTFIQLPDTGIQPRSALGFSLMAMLKAVGEQELFTQAQELAQTLRPQDLEAKGQDLAKRLRGFVPVVYASTRNLSVAYNWKIKFNETGKIPAFYNVFPELNHNEMTGFDVALASKALSEKMYFLFMKDAADHPQIQKRQVVTEKLYQDRGLHTEIVELGGENQLQKIFSSLLLADWAAYYTAQQYGLESEQVPMVEEFKKLIR